MRTPSLLLRLLLCVALVLNGATAAFAGVGQASAIESVADAPPCDQHHDAAGTMSMHAPPSADHDGVHKHADDCCKASTCLCDCVSHAQVAMFDFRWQLREPTADLRGRHSYASHHAPALRDLIRPPIG